MKLWLKQNFLLVEWLLGAFVCTLALVVWIDERSIGKEALGVYDLFPVFGLLAFGLMWSHYTFGSLRRMLGRKKVAHDSYWVVSSGIVLALIVLHPLLLNYGLIRDGLGLPPASYASAYGGDAVYLLLGTTALFIFLSYELHRWFKDRNWWRYIEWAQILAMVLIFIHGTNLGRETAEGWYRVFWWLLGLTLLLSWVYNWRYDKHIHDRRERGVEE
ncbi:MAG TPA: hypothetical protein VGE34_00575 [Candidatus Saccharimonadales bacterium]